MCTQICALCIQLCVMSCWFLFMHQQAFQEASFFCYVAQILHKLFQLVTKQYVCV